MTEVTESDGDWYDSSTVQGIGWITFAATLLIVGGVFKIFDALWAFKYDDDVPEGLQTVLFENDLAYWGWVWLLLGILLIAAGFAVLRGAQWARWFGIIVAGVAAIAVFPWIYFQPLWTILSVSVALMAVYALAAYGGPGGPAQRSTRVG